VTAVPGQIMVAEAPTVTEGASDGFTVMVIGPDVALTGEAQAALEVITQVITLPFASIAFV
jgi:hypothetical protein